MGSAKFKLIVEVDGNEVSNDELGSQALSGLVNSCPDAVEYRSLFGYLALSPSSQVRADVAYRDNLCEKTVELLANDSSMDVRRRLCVQTTFKEWVSTEMLADFINSDADMAKTIASAISEYSNADVNTIATELAKHTDPDVRLSLADNWGTPKKLLKQLLSDNDASVRASAKRTLG